MTKHESRERKAAWTQAVSEGRVLVFDSGMTFKSYPTVDAMHAARVAFQQAGIPVNIVGADITPCDCPSCTGKAVR